MARPASLRRTLAGLGARVVAEVRRPDHHPLSAADVEVALGRARAAGGSLVVCTEKDAVKLPASAAGEERLAVLRIEVEVAAGAASLDALLDALPRSGP